MWPSQVLLSRRGVSGYVARNPFGFLSIVVKAESEKQSKQREKCEIKFEFIRTRVARFIRNERDSERSEYDDVIIIYTLRNVYVIKF